MTDDTSAHGPDEAQPQDATQTEPSYLAPAAAAPRRAECSGLAQRAEFPIPVGRSG
jgi:hypothetical protein